MCGIHEAPDFLESKDNIYRKDPLRGSFSLNNCCGSGTQWAPLVKDSIY